MRLMEKGIQLLRFNNLANHNEISCGVSTRQGGVSIGSYSSLNLSFNCGNDANLVDKNRALLAESFGVPVDKLFFPNQCHTNRVQIVNSGIEDLSKTDAIITKKSGLAIGVLAADCVPVLFCDTKNGVIGAAHAGWRGTTKRIVQKVIESMSKSFNSQHKDIIVGIGPCIQQRNYEVGVEVLEQVRLLGDNIVNKSVIAGNIAGKVLIDLQLINKLLLQEVGLPAKNIEIMQRCTYDEEQLFFSARRDGFETGRFGAVISIM